MQRRAGKRQSKKLHEVDVLLGVRLRARREEIGVSQATVAKAAGVTFQQLQKYETGTNRVSASRLYDIAQFLKVPISYFFDEPVVSERRVEAETDELIEAFQQLAPGLRTHLKALLRSVVSK